MLRVVIIRAVLAAGLFASQSNLLAQDFAGWKPSPSDWKGAAVKDGNRLMTAEKWSFLLAPEESSDGAI